MDEGKITITWDEMNSPRVDAEIRRSEVAARVAAHQQEVQTLTPSVQRMGAGFFRKSIVYMALFGLAASLLAWGLGESLQYQERHDPWLQSRIMLRAFLDHHPDADDLQWFNLLDNLHENGISRELRDNPYLQRSFWAQPDAERSKAIEEAGRKCDRRRMLLDRWWQTLLGLAIGLGVSVAEPVVGRNWKSAAIHAVIGAVLGALGGFVCSLFINDIYDALGGGADATPFVQQVFARGVGWSILGAFLAIAPGLVMRNWKKLLLGLAGGAIGGLVGGMLFDPICALTGSDIPARCVNILGLGVGAAVATALLEEAAKQGWLKVATGVITGKQFILYRNPTVIGSSPNAEIYLFKDPTVAPRHAAINGGGGEFLLTALNDATVLLNGRPVRQQRLRKGDQIRIGNTVFLFDARAANTTAR